MKHNIFETRQRAQELMQQALNIWRASDQSFNLEGLEKDPVFSVIMSALAYQANTLDNEIEELKTEIVEEFSRTLSVDAMGCAVPATVVVKTNAVGSQPVDINGETPFFASADINLVPILKSRVFNIQNVEVEQIDGRRWSVVLDLPETVDSLRGMTFAIPELPYHELRVYVNDDEGKECQLGVITPEEPANMPFSEPFSLETLLFNRKQAVNCSGSNGNLSPYYRNITMDLFAMQDVSIYMFEGVEGMNIQTPRKHWELVFEFDGIGSKFFFNIAQVAFNVLLLANVNVRTVTITKDVPMVRLTNGNDDANFLYLLHPDSNQIYSSLPLMVRKVNVDRFNGTRLVKLLTYLIGKYNTDYYAFHNMNATEADLNMKHIADALYSLLEMARTDNGSGEGVYVVIPADKRAAMDNAASLDVRYLTTQGGKATLVLNKDTVIHVPDSLEAERTKQIVAPMLGQDALGNSQAEMSLRRYMMNSNDRLVTPSDLKAFCYNELLMRYSIMPEMILDISVKHERFDQGSYHTYCILVRITLSPNNFVKRAFEGKTETVERYLQKMMQVRTVGVYPVKVKMVI